MSRAQNETDMEKWESGELGNDEQFVRRSEAAREKLVDDSMDLQMISIRLQRGLLEALKVIADVHNIGYQPMIRDILTRFAQAEIRDIKHRLRAEAATEQRSAAEQESPGAKFFQEPRCVNG